MTSTENKNIKISKRLLIKTIVMYLFALLLVGILLFLPAGTLKYRNAWLFTGALFIPMLIALIYLTAKDPRLLEKRLKAKEKEKPQKIYVILSIFIFSMTFIIPGLDFRNHWSEIPTSVVIISTILMLTGYIMFFVVMVQNSYASRIIEIQESQKLIDTGMYSVVRHPMYLAASILYGFSPLVLGSYFGLIPAIFIPIVLVIRIKNEEKVLLKGLPGYDLYMKKVKYRMIPFIW